MELKKNPQVDLNKDSGLFFVIGLAITLFIVWRALEMKTYDTQTEVLTVMDAVENLNEEVPITKMFQAPPPPPPAAPEIIQVIEDIEDIEETFIESTETNQDAVIEEVIEVEDVEVAEEEEDISVPFAIIENVPIYPGCEKGSEKEKIACFQRKILEHVKTNFKYPPAALEMNITGRVHVMFEIDNNGRVSHIKKRGPDILLEKEAERIISLLPKMVPGKQRGRSVRVKYSIPINFKMRSAI